MLITTTTTKKERPKYITTEYERNLLKPCWNEIHKLSNALRKAAEDFYDLQFKQTKKSQNKEEWVLLKMDTWLKEK